MRVFVLGHRGMLGHVVARYFAQKGHEIITSDSRYAGDPRDPLVEAVRESECPWVINAAGRIKQKSAEPAELYLINSQFPVHLKARLRPSQQLVQASTDCVFSGKRGDYGAAEERDADDVYGFSKILGEVIAESGRCWVLRTSIVGPGLTGSPGLMGWFLSQRGAVKGFVNHRWNGITTLEWAKVALELLEGELVSTAPVVQVGVVPGVSKFELLQLFARTWGHPIEIIPTEAAEAVDRTLRPEVRRAPLDDQLEQFKAWYG